jgi:tetratricopeptide (TPR) repeat protein
MRRGITLLFILAGFSLACFSQDGAADSLKELRDTKEDTARVTLLDNLCSAKLKALQFAEAAQYAQQAYQLAGKLNYHKGWAVSLVLMGSAADAQGNYDSAIACYNRALPVFESLHEKKRIGNVQIGLGNAYEYKGNRQKALESYILSLKTREELGDSVDMAGSLLGIGNCYYDLKMFSKAIDSYERSYGIYKRHHRKDMLGWLLNNLGGVYTTWGKPDRAMEYFQQAVKVKKEAGENDFGLSTTYSNMADIYLHQGNYMEALRYAQQTLDIRLKVNDAHELASAYNKVGIVYRYGKHYPQAAEMFGKAIELGEKTRSYDILESSYNGMAEVLYNWGRIKEAYEYRILFEHAKDSLLNMESSRQSHELAAQYEADKREQQIKFLNKDKQLQSAELNKQKLIIYAGSACLALVLSLTFVILRSLRLNQKKNRIISLQKATVERQKEIVEEKQKEILDSIHYAKRIQQALLPSRNYIARKIKGLK